LLKELCDSSVKLKQMCDCRMFTLEAQEGRLFAPLAFTKTYAMAAAAGLAVTLISVLMVGGMITAPLLSMFVVPAVHLLLRRRQLRTHPSGDSA